MNFLYPNFLWALTAIAIPIIIHLFNFRKFKTVYFSNVAFLKNIKEETKSKSQLKTEKVRDRRDATDPGHLRVDELGARVLD